MATLWCRIAGRSGLLIRPPFFLAAGTKPDMVTDNIKR
ncbi:MAG: hypothetical protein ACI9R3_002527 [Verrucomicrobiales bacterium]|jgi:hypothetical protein